VRTGLGDILAAALARGLHALGPRAYAHVLESLQARQDSRLFDDFLAGLELECPPAAAPDPAERGLVERIFRAYRSAKLAEARSDPVFAPASLWSGLLRDGYAPLLDAHAREDVDPFHAYLANFAGLEAETAIEESHRLRRLARDPGRKRRFERDVAAPLVAWWLANEARGRDLSALELGAAGNPCALRVAGHRVSRQSLFSDVHAGLLAGFLGGPGGLVGELGGGAGRTAIALFRRARPACYVGLDLPEPLACATYLLLRTFPAARFLLHGEEPFGADALARFDFVMLPAFEIGMLPADAFDLFWNENSLGELGPESARRYAAEIGRTSLAFWHRNHEHPGRVFEDGSRALAAEEYPLPPDRFACLARHPDLSQTMLRPWPRRDRDLYWYLYLRRGEELRGARVRGRAWQGTGGSTTL
jgi:hypothetical protein